MAFMSALEPRLLLTGDISAVVKSGDLIITGGSTDTAITINADRLGAGELRLIPDDFSPINGASDPLIVSGVTGSVRIKLRGGADRIRLDDLNLSGSLTINAGSGNDIILLTNTRVVGRLKVSGGAGDDSVNVISSTIAQRASINSGTGADVLTFDGTDFRGAFSGHGGAGSDIYSAEDVTFPGSIRPQRVQSAQAVAPIVHEFDFNDGQQGWRADFSDYPTGEEEFYELDSGIRDIPGPTPGRGFFINGANHSDDLFMYLKRPLGPGDGIAAGRTYQVRFEIVFASAAPEGCHGIGGSPGNSVWLKAGADAREPNSPIVEGRREINVDKGNQSSGGSAASVAGNISNGIPCDEALENPKGPPWRLVSRRHVHTFRRRAGSDGKLWLLVGTDSGFEGTTRLYYQRINVTLTPLTG